MKEEGVLDGALGDKDARRVGCPDVQIHFDVRDERSVLPHDGALLDAPNLDGRGTSSEPLLRLDQGRELSAPRRSGPRGRVAELASGVGRKDVTHRERDSLTFLPDWLGGCR